MVATADGRVLKPGVLWAGGAATALVAGLVVVVGSLLCRGVAGVPLLAPDRAGRWHEAATLPYATAAALGALLATGVMQFLLLAAPSPARFFGWLMTLATLASVVAPLAGRGPDEGRLATALVNLVVGIAIGSLVAMSARAACRRAGPPVASPIPPPYRPA